jgi:hypothetical protein
MTWFKGILIGMFYFFVVVFSALLLATAQFRSSSGSAFDTWRLNYDSNRVLTNIHEQKLKDLQKESDTNWDLLNWAEQCLRLYDSSGRPKSGIEIETKQDMEALRAGKKKYDDLSGDAKCISRGLTILQYDKNYYAKKDADYREEILKVKNLLKLDEEQHSDLIKGHLEFLGLKEAEKVWYTRLFVNIPYDLLVLFLVMLMGALGGIIRILRDYHAADRSNPSSKDYFFVPLIGAVVGIGGYILAKTGLLLLSSTKGETSLSPFMIGLVGMVSGLLAKEVVDKIAEYGRDMLKSKREQPGQGGGER